MLRVSPPSSKRSVVVVIDSLRRVSALKVSTLKVSALKVRERIKRE
jgi:hypothetical protein